MKGDYTIGPEIIKLVERLFDEGYSGTASLTRFYPLGIADSLKDCFSIELTGFCKETLYLVQDTLSPSMFAFGRYSLETEWEFGDPDVKDIVAIAWSMFNTYEGRGYSMPLEFKDLFLKYDYIEEQTKTVTEIVRKK